MVKMLVSLAAVGLLGASECRAQFVDNFDGEVLAPHWVIWGEPSHLEHTVGGGLLTVTDLPYPSGKHSPTNNASIHTYFPGVAGDASARMVLGWAPGTGRNLQYAVGGSTSVLGMITYHEPATGSPLVRVWSGSGIVVGVPAPPAGMHDLLLTRQGSSMRAFLNGTLLASFPTSDSGPVQYVSLAMSVQYPNSGMQPVFVDRVEIVPAPATAACLAMFVAIHSTRRRR